MIGGEQVCPVPYRACSAILAISSQMHIIAVAHCLHQHLKHADAWQMVVQTNGGLIACVVLFDFHCRIALVVAQIPHKGFMV